MPEMWLQTYQISEAANLKAIKVLEGETWGALAVSRGIVLPRNLLGTTINIIEISMGKEYAGYGFY